MIAYRASRSIGSSICYNSCCSLRSIGSCYFHASRAEKRKIEGFGRRPISSMSSEESSSLVACNVYITAGADSVNHRPILLSLARQTQDAIIQAIASSSSTGATTDLSGHVESLRDPKPVVAVGALVHAYTDPVYNRSSIHLAGSPSVVAPVVTHLVTSACRALVQLQQTTNDYKQERQTPHPEDVQSTMTSATPHPTVGLVDHVAVMPLLSLSQPPTDPGVSGDDSLQQHCQSAQWTARHISTALQNEQYESFNGQRIIDNRLEVVEYGTLLSPYQSLADVRRTRTRFFQTIADTKHESQALPPQSNLHAGALPLPSPTVEVQSHNMILVGSTVDFVENYNVRLQGRSSSDQFDSSSITLQQHARHLCRLIRERSGVGLPFVEALTLPYNTIHHATDTTSGDSLERSRAATTSTFEVACNLLRPSISSSKDIDAVVQRYVQDVGIETLVESSYRVGTTAAQCHEALRAVSDSTSARRDYDSTVLRSLDDMLA